MQALPFTDAALQESARLEPVAKPLRKGWMRREECVVKNLARCCGSTRFRSVQWASNGPSTRASGWVWQQVVEQFPSAIADADSDGHIVAMNRAFRVQLSYWPATDEFARSSLGEDLLAKVRAVMESPSPVDRRAESTSGVVFSCQFVGDQAGLIALVADPH